MLKRVNLYVSWFFLFLPNFQIIHLEQTCPSASRSTWMSHMPPEGPHQSNLADKSSCKVWLHHLQIQWIILRGTQIFISSGSIVNRRRIGKSLMHRVLRRFANWQWHVFIELILHNIFMKSPVNVLHLEICTETLENLFSAIIQSNPKLKGTGFRTKTHFLSGWRLLWRIDLRRIEICHWIQFSHKLP